MKIARTLTLVLGIVFLVSCGGTSGSSDVPQVSGSYTCVDQCTGVCGATTIQVTQSGSTITANSPQLNCAGEIDSNGEFTAGCKSSGTAVGSCAGNFSSGGLTADCNYSGTQCQTVFYQKD